MKMKQCAECKMDVPEGAFKCGHCGEWFDKSKAPKGKDTWEKSDIVVRGLSVLLVPLLLFWLGDLANKSLTESQNKPKFAEVDAKLVEVAIGVLKTDAVNTERQKNLRRWAVNVINKRLDVKMPLDVQDTIIQDALPYPNRPSTRIFPPRNARTDNADRLNSASVLRSDNDSTPRLIPAHFYEPLKGGLLLNYTWKVKIVPARPDQHYPEGKVIEYAMDAPNDIPMLKPSFKFKLGEETHTLRTDFKPGTVQKGVISDGGATQYEGNVLIMQNIQFPGKVTMTVIFSTPNSPKWKSCAFNGTMKLSQ